MHLALGDIAIDSSNPPSKIHVFLKRSKTDQFSRGVTVFLGATGDEVCPVAAIVRLLQYQEMLPACFSASRQNATN